MEENILERQLKHYTQKLIRNGYLGASRGTSSKTFEADFLKQLSDQATPPDRIEMNFLRIFDGQKAKIGMVFKIDVNALTMYISSIRMELPGGFTGSYSLNKNATLPNINKDYKALKHNNSIKLKNPLLHRSFSSKSRKGRSR